MSLHHQDPYVISLADSYRGNPIEGSKRIMKHKLEGVVRQTGDSYYTHVLDVASQTYSITSNKVDFFKGMFHDSVEDGQFDIHEVGLLARILFDEGDSLGRNVETEMEVLTHDKNDSYQVYIHKFPTNTSWKRKGTAIAKVVDTKSNTNPDDIFDRSIAANQYDRIRELVPRNKQREYLEKKIAVSPIFRPRGPITKSLFVERREDLFYKKLQRNATENFTTIIPLFESYLIRELGRDDKGKFSMQLAQERTYNHYSLGELNKLFDELAINSFKIWKREGHNLDYFYEKILEIGYHRGKKDPIGFESVLDRIDFVNLYHEKSDSVFLGRLFP